MRGDSTVVSRGAHSMGVFTVRRVPCSQLRCPSRCQRGSHRPSAAPPSDLCACMQLRSLIPRLPGQLLTSHPPCRRSYVLTAAFQRGTDAAQVVHLHLPVTSPRGSLGAEHPIPVTCAGGDAAMRALSSACVVTSQEVPAEAPSLRSRSRTASSETGVGTSAWPVDASGASSGAGAGAGAGAGGGAGLRVDGKMPWEQGWSCDVVAPAQDVVVSVRGFGLSTGQSRASHAASAEPDVSGPRSFAVTSSGVHLGKVVLDRCVALPGSSLRLLLDMSGAAVQTLQVRQPMCGRHGRAVVVDIRASCRPVVIPNCLGYRVSGMRAIGAAGTSVPTRRWWYWLGGERQ